MAAIRSLLHDAPAEQAAPAERPERQQILAPLPEGYGPSKRKAKKAKAEKIDAPARAKPAKPEKQVRSEGGPGLVMRILGHDYAFKGVLCAGALLIVYARPLLFLGVAILMIILMTAVFMILGYDTFWRRVVGLVRRYAERRPDRSADLQMKLDRFAMRWDAVLDRFPEGSVDGLYLPDFGEIAQADEKHNAALDRRFTQMHHTEG
jgi:hypothetical protein